MVRLLPWIACAAVLVLLPPSEGKTAPAGGPSLDLAALAFPARTPRRERLLGVLERLCAGSQARALRALGLSAGQAGEVELDAALRTAPAAPAAEVYTGVLYERLRLPELAPEAQARALIASALWGMLRPSDPIPAYRLSMAARLPRVGPLSAYWRPALGKALPDDGLVVDLRSGAYAAAWKPRAAAVVGVRARTEGGAVISHMVKATRGDVARVLLEAAAPPTSPDEVAHLVAASGRTVELARSASGWSLDVIEAG
jgi:cytoplasmic iron level regulating protein YaaA (DUF328/UPF0246 family)